MLKINTFQNLTQFLVYFKEYINICKLKKQCLSCTKYSVKNWKLFLTTYYFYFSKTSDSYWILDCRPFTPHNDGKNRRSKTMCGIIKPRPNEIIIFNNFRALEEVIAEIQETENIRNEREFFQSYRIKIMKLD